MFDPNRAFATSYTTVTPNDAADLPRPIKGLNVSAAGLVQITTVGTDSAPAWTGAIHVDTGDVGTAPIARVWATGTTATIAAGIL